ncbi:MAG: succinate dehydrogenase iron-sulfur subunit [Nitrososphaeraceae archaeon]|jgi:succinate dehydrogenase / fumarate reductase iron-sulfur subunit
MKKKFLLARDTSEINLPRASDDTSDIVLNIYRGGPNQKPENSYDSYRVPVSRWTTVLDALIYAKERLDSSVAIRYSCRMASCGSCGMKINGIPRLACYTKISELGTHTITCEPLPNFPLIRDLVTDFQEFFDHHKKIQPYIQNLHPDPSIDKLSEFEQTPQEVDEFLQFSYCIKCGLCYSACPTVATDTKFPGPQALAQAYRYFADSRDDAVEKRLSIVDDKHGIWRCHFAGSCSKVCPKGVDPALGIQMLRSHMMSITKKPKKRLAELRETSREGS